jgi:membrane protease YdiL (CAAX protease family)
VAVVALDAPFVGIVAGFYAFPLVAGMLSWVALWRGHIRQRWGWTFSARAIGVGVGGGVVLFALLGVTAPIDAALFGSGGDPGAGSGFADVSAVLLAAYVVGNGVLVPIAEEQVWRGIVQTEFVERLGVAGGILLTAVLFSLKHAVVDWSLARLVTITVGGVGLGLLRHRWGTASSTVGHVTLNLAASLVVILTF